MRFRTAIRDPEELIYLFVCIGLGLGFGANQWLIVSIAFVAVSLSLIVLALLRRRGEGSGALWLLVQAPAGVKIAADLVAKTVEAVTKRASLTRFDSSDAKTEATFDVELDPRTHSVSALVAAVQSLAPGVRCLLVDQPSRPVE